MTLVARSQDLSRLVDESYDIEVRDGNLLVHHVPYVTPVGEVDYCILVSELTTNGAQTSTPGRHEMWVVGEVPHDHQGNKVRIVIDEERTDFGEGLVACCRMSGKPGGQPPTDYYEKVTTYVQVLARYARAIRPDVTYTDAPPRESTPSESVFRYHDAATSRAGISAVTSKLRLGKVALVGLGGTGSYILDLIAKTPIDELHLYDGDVMLAHNAFRSPGAATLEELLTSPCKVDYLAAKYDVMRRGIHPHAAPIDETNVSELASMDFVFVAIDAGPAKQLIIERLIASDVSFVDCGIGVLRQDNTLRGKVRVTAGRAGQYEHIPRRISYVDVDADEYRRNIQTGDLNMLSAVMAVIKWKKMCGYYADSRDEMNSLYTVATNQLLSAEVVACD